MTGGHTSGGRTRRLVLLLLAALLTVAACSTGDDAVERGSDYTFTSPGGKTRLFYNGADRKRIADLHGEALRNPGKRIHLSDYQGKVIVLNLWGSWCGPCRAEAPELQKAAAPFRGKVQLLGLDVRDNRQSARDFMRGRGLHYPSIYDFPGRALLPLGNYPASAVPSTIVIDQRRRVAAVFLTALNAGDLTPLLRKLTSEPRR